MAVKVGINGFGRIGRNFYRAVLASGADVEIVGVQSVGDKEAGQELVGKHEADELGCVLIRQLHDARQPRSVQLADEL